jgi:hypothetical protein
MIDSSSPPASPVANSRVMSVKSNFASSAPTYRTNSGMPIRIISAMISAPSLASA